MTGESLPLTVYIETCYETRHGVLGMARTQTTIIKNGFFRLAGVHGNTRVTRGGGRTDSKSV